MENNEQQVNPLLMDFLDLDTYKERSEFIWKHKEDITDRLVEDMAMSLDVVLEKGDLDAKIRQLINCIELHAKFECTRLR